MMPEARFHFVKSPTCVEVPAHGVFGGLTPQGKISIAVYSERRPIPQETVYEVTDGLLGAEKIDQRVSKQDFERIVQAILYLDVAVAESVRDWLGKWIEQSKQIGGQKS